MQFAVCNYCFFFSFHFSYFSESKYDDLFWVNYQVLYDGCKLEEVN